MDKVALTPEQLKELLGNMTRKDVLLSPEFSKSFNVLIHNYDERIDAIIRERGKPKSHPFLTLRKKLCDTNMPLTCPHFINLYVAASAKQLDCNKVSSAERRWIMDTGDYLYRQTISRIIENKLKTKENETDKTDGNNTEA